MCWMRIEFSLYLQNRELDLQVLYNFYEDHLRPLQMILMFALTKNTLLVWANSSCLNKIVMNSL